MCSKLLFPLNLHFFSIRVSAEGQLRENGVVMETQTSEEVFEVLIVTRMSHQEGGGEEEDERRKTHGAWEQSSA